MESFHPPAHILILLESLRRDSACSHAHGPVFSQDVQKLALEWANLRCQFTTIRLSLKFNGISWGGRWYRRLFQSDRLSRLVLLMFSQHLDIFAKNLPYSVLSGKFYAVRCPDQFHLFP